MTEFGSSVPPDDEDLSSFTLGENMSRTLIALLLITILAGTALADAPLSGTYNSDDIGGTIATGRYTEAWAPGGSALMPGTTMNAQSWDGAVLGAEWSYTCGVLLSAPMLLTDTVINGSGNRTYMKTFVGGEIWLSGSGPWANGDAYYSGPILSYTEFETVQFVDDVPVHAVTNVQATARFDGYPDECVAFSVANGIEIGSTDLGDPMPMNYPDFLTDSCTPGAAEGAWWDMFQMSLYIQGCSVSNEDLDWGQIKSMYRD